MTENKTIAFSDEALAKAKKIIARYPEGKQKSAMLPLLHLAQAEFDGWLSPEVMDYVATLMNVKPIEVYEVATFYSMFNTKPVGKFLLEVCQTSSCWLRGSNEIVNHIKKRLNIEVGETTDDGLFTLKTVECLGSCGTAPMLQCGADFHENLTIEKVDELIDALKNKKERSSYLKSLVNS
ncbi:MAG TPA: NADH-quinone oxidoreductase subunit NuoE [Cytophagales bacterium]|jgi:NADH-quinone oxidoreductase subunit E|nr:NADH-quinone oxidoreductase subunit NuoE [Cytophagales bacterium]